MEGSSLEYQTTSPSSSGLEKHDPGLGDDLAVNHERSRLDPTSGPLIRFAAFLAWCLSALAAALTMAVALQVGGGSPWAKTLSNLSFIVAPAVAGVACLRRSRHAVDRGGWRLLGLSALVWSAGAVAWAVYGITGDDVYPFPSLADVGFLGYALPAALGVLSLRGPRLPRRVQYWAMLDAAVIAASVLFISWTTVLGPLYRLPVHGVVERVVGLAYPVTDAVIVSLVIAMGMRKPQGSRLAWAFLASAFTTLAVTDSTYVSRSLTGSYDGGHPLDAGWTVAFLLLALAAAAPGRGASPEARLTRAQELVPYVPAGMALVVAGVQRIHWTTTPFLFWNGVLLLALLALRQVVIVSEKISLAEDLEARVETRTLELLGRTAELYGERQFLGALLENLEEGVVACDGDGVLTFFNHASRRLHGLPAEPIPPERWTEHYRLRHIDGRTPLSVEEIPLFRALRGEAVSNAEIVIAPRDGPSRQVAASGRAITDAEGRGLGAVVAMHDITDRRRAQEELYRKAFYDDLTGLPNRAAAWEHLSRPLADDGDTAATVAVLFCDLDNFKVVNDGASPEVGDELLLAVSERLLSNLGPGDKAYRFGGDEFIVVIEDATDRGYAAGLARRLVATMEQPFEVAGRHFFVSMSVGFALSQLGVHPHQLLGHAEVALRQAKVDGKSRSEAFKPSMLEAIVRRIDLEAELRRALEHDELVVWYQPKLSMASGVMVGVEALVRWDHPRRGLVPPDQFIPVAEEAGLIARLGEWVLRQACTQAGVWQQRYGSPLSVAVNVSTYQLRQPGLVEAVSSALAASGLGSASLVLEITEGSLIEERGGPLAILAELKGLGVQLSVDDFGTGYSSLARLWHLPIDELKIDKSFVKEIGASDGADSMVSAILAMAEALARRVVAEGVETTEQLAFLRDHGCDQVQGYLIARPGLPDHLEGLLANPGDVLRLQPPVKG
ncbi:MAG: EAL domain-containing protein [Actinomycetota bacterium]|nr:EAL domain-containing protein [Actinomycetota bacterium]